jgi:hypothetical protein
MTREDAQRLVQSFLRGLGQSQSPGLNPQGFGGVAVADAQLYFEYRSGEQALECSALIYKFREAPKPGVIEGFEQEEKSGTDTGGGKVDYEPENKSLFLSRTYANAPSEPAFAEDMKRLMQASTVWGDTVMDRVASRVFKT